MSAIIINGNEISKKVREELKQRAAKLKAKGILPGLAVVIVGDDPASKIYVGATTNKAPECKSRHSRHPGAIAITQAH